MLRRVLRDLTLNDFVVGGGPLVLAVWFFIRAALVDGSFARWAWITCAVLMLVICAAYLTWVWRRRHELRAGARAGDHAEAGGQIPAE